MIRCHVSRLPKEAFSINTKRLPRDWNWKGYVYFLVKGEFVVYVGMTTTISNRLANHRRTDFDYVYLMDGPKFHVHLGPIERYFIRRLWPILNKLNNPMRDPRLREELIRLRK